MREGKITPAYRYRIIECDSCAGSGRAGRYECENCGGYGWLCADCTVCDQEAKLNEDNECEDCAGFVTVQGDPLKGLGEAA